MLYPQQNDCRNLFDLSGIWEFQLDPQQAGEGEGWFNRLPSARPIAVPGSWNEQVAEAYNYLGRAWYARAFYVPRGWQGQRIFLRFGSANYAARVWLNGEWIGAHQGGHLPFEFDVTARVKWGEPNQLAVEVENEQQPERVPPGNVSSPMNLVTGAYPNTSYDFFPYAGLHRPVQLVAVPQKYIEDITVTTAIHGAEGVVRARVQAAGEYSKAAGAVPGRSHRISSPRQEPPQRHLVVGGQRASLSQPCDGHAHRQLCPG